MDARLDQPASTVLNRLGNRKTEKWDLKAIGKHQPGKGGGCGKVMDSAAFGIAFYDDPTHAMALAAMHSRISHCDVVSQAACWAMARGIALAIEGKKELKTIVNEMEVAATMISILYGNDEQDEWNATPASYKPKNKRAPDTPPYTTRQRIADAIQAEENGTSPDDFYEENKGWGALDFVAAVVFTALRAQRKGWSVSEAINCAINTTAGTDRDKSCLWHRTVSGRPEWSREWYYRKRAVST